MSIKNDKNSKKIGVKVPSVIFVVLVLLSSALPVSAASQGTFDPPHEDFGWDTNGNGLYDYLVVNVSINVTSPGDFILSADLYDNLGLFPITYTWNYTTLFAGKNEVLMMFTGCEIYASGENGPYKVEISMNSDSGSETDIYYTSFYQYTDFEPPNAQFSPPHYDYGLDTSNPENGLFNYLVLEVNISVIVAGTYDVFATLMKSFQYIDDEGNSTYLDVGMNSVELRFFGPTIFNYNEDGPYDIELTLYDESFNELDTNLHVTSSFKCSQFDPPPAQFSQPYDDCGIDTDSPQNGLYDFLVVNVHVNVIVEGAYEVGAVLLDGYDNYICDATNTTYLDKGSQIVKLTFPGTPIFVNEIDGPFYALLLMYDDAYHELDSDTYETNFYLFTDFDPPAAVFLPPYNDYGLDTDSPNNGLFDYLVVEVDISVTEAGVYEVGSSLVDDYFNFIAFDFNKTYFDLGIQTLELRFYGPAIYANGWDGPFRVFLFLSDVNSCGLDEDIQYTDYYSYSDFDSPPATLSQPYFDFPLDTDAPANGLFDQLVINVNISVYEGGIYTIMAILYDDSQTISLVASSNSTYLGAGDVFMQLYFDGWVMGLLGIDGPYLAQIMLYDEDANMISREDYYTSSYSSGNFESSLPVILSEWASTKPAIDGVFSPAEWADAISVDISPLSGNMINAYILVKNDAEYLYICYDVIGDETQDFSDMASVAFDTNDDNLMTDRKEDQFTVGAWVNDKRHYVYRDDDWGWSIEDSPYDNSLPNHGNLQASCGFGTSDNGPAAHRIYELCIPLALIGTALGDTVGLAGYSYAGCGIADDFRGSSSWPAFFGDMPSLEVFGDLVLASSPQGNVAPTVSGPSVTPASGLADSTYFTYRMIYKDANNDLAQSPKVWINKSGVPIGGPYTMALEAWVGEVGNYVSGAIYSYSTKLSGYGTDYTFAFSASDGALGCVASSEMGPVVFLGPNPPSGMGMQGCLKNTPGLMNLTNHSPIINWTFSDPDGGSQAGFNVSVRTGPFGTGNLMWWNNQTGSVSSVTYGYDDTASPLMDGSTYYLLIKTKDSDELWGNWGELEFHMNSPPSAPANTAPSDGAQMPSKTDQVVQWSSAADSEGSPITYYWYVGLDFSFSTLFTSGSTNGLTSEQFETQPGSTYYWRVRAYDGHEFGLNTTTWSFTIANPPNPPINLGVEGYGINTPGSLNITDHTPKFNWTYSGSSGGSQGGYNISIYSGSLGTGTLMWWDDQTSSVSSVIYGYNGYSLPLEDNTDYYLRVKTKDDENQWGEWTEMKFHMNAPPQAPSLSLPTNGALNLEYGEQELKWNTVIDFEKSSITYEWQASKSPSFSSIAASGSVSQHHATFTTVSATKYYWRVRAFDGYERSGYSTVWNFTTAFAKGSVSGCIKDDENDPLKDTKVELYDSSGVLQFSSYTDSNGNFEFDNILAKEGYYLKISKEGYEPGESDAFDVQEGQTTSLTDIVLDAKKGTLSGTIKYSNGKPLKNANVMLLDHQNNIVDSQLTDSEGNFEFGDLDHGTYTIQVSKDGFTTYTSDELTLDAGEQKSVSDIDMVKKSDKTDFPWPIVLMIIIAVLVLITLVFFMSKRKK